MQEDTCTKDPPKEHVKMQISLDNPPSAPQPANAYYSQVARVELDGGE